MRKNSHLHRKFADDITAGGERRRKGSVSPPECRRKDSVQRVSLNENYDDKNKNSNDKNSDDKNNDNNENKNNDKRESKSNDNKNNDNTSGNEKCSKASYPFYSIFMRLPTTTTTTITTRTTRRKLLQKLSPQTSVPQQEQ
ncbi:hypothetical protein E2C01_093281 [Portunus trituberculatus]|uniref:Uncharacterized protein n=1 Tax=Portunus trituberculatus TaxID=210409 RepID=A0A5B7JTK1_PORTR|nr:hypothetical protein [Portunus trituberculatus]